MASGTSMANGRTVYSSSNSNTGDQFRRRKGESTFDKELDYLVETRKYFGWIETIGGILKICIVFGGGVFMYVIHAKGWFALPLQAYCR